MRNPEGGSAPLPDLPLGCLNARASEGEPPLRAPAPCGRVVAQPALEASSSYNFPVMVATRVSLKPFQLLKVSSTAVASYPQCTMQS